MYFYDDAFKNKLVKSKKKFLIFSVVFLILGISFIIFMLATLNRGNKTLNTILSCVIGTVLLFCSLFSFLFLKACSNFLKHIKKIEAKGINEVKCKEVVVDDELITIDRNFRVHEIEVYDGENKIERFYLSEYIDLNFLNNNSSTLLVSDNFIVGYKK